MYYYNTFFRVFESLVYGVLYLVYCVNLDCPINYCRQLKKLCFQELLKQEAKCCLWIFFQQAKLKISKQFLRPQIVGYKPIFQTCVYMLVEYFSVASHAKSYG